MYLGLDLSLTSTGVCALVTAHVAETTAIKPVNLIGVQRHKYLLRGIEEFIDGFGGQGSFELAAIEGYAMSAGDRGKCFHIGEWGGIVRLYMEIWGIPYIVVGPGQLKHFFTGNGAATKTQMGQVAQAVYDRDFLRSNWVGRKRNKPRPDNWGQEDGHWNNDETDAFALANVAALYSNDWGRIATLEQQSIIQAIRLDPMGVLSAQAKEKKAKEDAE